MSHLQNRITDLLLPMLGKSMTAAAIHTNCRRIGVSPDTLHRNNLGALSAELAKGLSVFVGADRAAVVARSIAMLE